MAVPKLRFNEFHNDWNKLTLDSIVKPNIIEVDKPTEDYVRLGIRSHCKGTFHQLVKIEDILEADKMFTVPKNNLIVNITFAWEQAIAITDENDEGKLVSGRFPTFAFKNGHLPQFYKFILPNKRLKYDLGLASPGGAGRNKVLNKKEFLKIKIGTTTIEEQQKIADFLTTFDKRITAQQNIIADMEETKKGLLQKIFSQEIRFKDDNGEDYPDWEKKSWKENVIISTDMVNPKNEEYINLPHVGPGNIESFNGCLLDNILTAKEENLISGKFHFMPGAIIYGKINPQLAKYAHVNFEGLSSADAYVLTATNSLCQNFLFFLLQSKDFFRYSVMVSRRTGMPKINRDELNAFKFMCPSLQEQQKIASFLSAYDKKIEAEKKILAYLQEMKKGLLQQMFV